ncbi:MAG: ABC transporter ATP-binding protein [Pseudomonadota bacterium]
MTLSAVEKSFGETRVLNGVSLDIRDGEFLTLVGPSGCGKSTLLRIMAGLEAMDSGGLAIGGQDVLTTRAADRNLAMVFQSYALYPHLTVRQNMLTPLKLRDLSWTQRLPVAGPLLARQRYQDLMAQVKETAEILKIEQLLDRKPGQMSGGQRQRAALGRAMVRKPAAFLMDEPLSNLDAALRVHMRSELADLHRALGTTFVYVTHDQAEALTMSDRMAVMMGGNILQLDTPDAIYTDPQHLDVATFVGSPRINLIDAEGRADGGVAAAGLVIAQAAQQHNHKIAHIAFRPEHATIKRASASDASAGDGLGVDAWPATITHLENLGSDLFVHCALEVGDVRVIVRTSPAAGLALGQSVAVAPDFERVIGFGVDKRRVDLQSRKAKAPSVGAAA